MPQFELPEMTPVVITNVNVRSELHGTEHVPAVDIDFKLTTSNDILSTFHGALKGMFYAAAERGDQPQPELDGVPAVSDLTRLICPYLEPIRLKKEYVGYELTIDYGLGGSSNIEMGECEVNNFKLDCKEGGSVEVKFRVQAAGLNEGTLGKVAALIGHEVEITLPAPEDRQEGLKEPQQGENWPFPQGEKQAPIDGTQAAFEKDHPPAKGKGKKGAKSDSEKAADATAAFVEAHGETEGAES